MQAFADPTRVRLLSLLADEELTVAELTNITGLPQSRVSTHLARLRESGMLRDRKLGASTFYTQAGPATPAAARALWELVTAQLGDAVLEGDRARREALLRERAGSWVDSVAGELERHYSPGRTWDATARGLLGLTRFGDVLDVGSGDGAVAELYVTRARSVTLLDSSERMLEAARRRLGRHENVSFVKGDMHGLPFGDACFDEVLLLNVLTYASEPRVVVSEAARVLRPGGRSSFVTLAEHPHQALTRSYGHENGGFSSIALQALCEERGLTVELAAITSRERKKPHFEIVSVFCEKP